MTNFNIIIWVDKNTNTDVLERMQKECEIINSIEKYFRYFGGLRLSIHTSAMILQDEICGPNQKIQGFDLVLPTNNFFEPKSTESR